MDKQLLEKSPEIAPLLVHLYDKHKLYNLAKDQDPMAQAELATVMVDLLEAELTPRESELISDVLVGLMRQAEKDLRAALAERLCTSENVPLRMVLHLANDEIMIADHVLRQSPVLHDMDLIYIIKSQGSDHWKSIAQRTDLSGQVVDVLAGTKDLGTAITLTENKRVNLTHNAIEIFAEMAKTSNELATPLLSREEMPAGIASALYDFVGQELQKYIQETYNVQGHEIQETLDDIVIEFKEADVFKYTPSASMLKSAENMMRHKELRMPVIMDSLRRGQIANFIAQFSVYCSLPVNTVEEILKQESGQGLAIACKAMEIQKSDFVTIYLQTHKVRTEDARIINQHELARAISYYDRIKMTDARMILKQSRH